ncbi:MAG: L,D-transpeptidase/peptidoglycan binding protein [Micrococcales bacterium]|nr:L,D-transpeptidase/peptidoglycan binding protein [Micrococcales bacterium]
MSRRRLALTAAVAVPLVLGGAGTAYATHYQDKALPGSAVGGVPVAGMTRDEVAETVRERAAAVTVTLTNGGSTRTAHLAELGYAVDVEATVDELFTANREWSSYARSLVTPRDVPAVVSTDDRTLAAVVTSLVADADKAGRDATVSLAKDKRSFVVSPAVAGQTVDPATFQDVVARAAHRLAPARTTLRFVEGTPKVSTAVAQHVADAANAIVNAPFSVTDGTKSYPAAPYTKASWVTVPVSDGVPQAPIVDAAKVRAWVGAVAKAATVEPTTGLRYVDSAGTVRKVVTEAEDGRTPKNADQLAGAAVAALGSGGTYAGTLAFSPVRATWDEKRIAPGAENLAYPAAVGEKWIDVDLGRHTMTAYIGAEVVYGPIAMVNGAAATPTSVGTFHVYLKNPLMTMRGRNADGTNYETPDVPWSSFFVGGIALHGAPWRSSFGYAASHGCINLPVPVAKWVYDFAPVGTTVVSHY